ncbi:DUF2252 domain-containing protein [Oryzihumus leptocrescens]|uniref:Uncharacterized protein (DUF2252 family) n=1 Tax=Oryzihumus leptocrescens TaxID=297536 RepID=A0A542ZJS8_9MICO|nr:DUF2252 domain-containing protein [Oryzihumus leptocrescens]TQL60607.1 uncharacterized protein (DUF2252 family) [Oryzihumus leptocrescens]
MSLPTPAQRRASGRSLRSAVPRSSHAGWHPPDSRPDPVATLRATDAVRLSELLGLRYSRMSASPFTFLRGSASVMAADLATTAQSGLWVQACGDAHIGNFRLLGTPEREINLDINDFDETLPAPFEWDLKRLAASAVVVGRQNGFSPEVCSGAALAAARSYRLRMAEYARERPLEVWYSSIDSLTLQDVVRHAQIDAQQKRLAHRRINKARRKDNLRAFRRLTTTVDGTLRFRDDPPRLYHHPQDDDIVHRAMTSYRGTLPHHVQVLFDRFELVDYSVKVVGVGSVGTRCWAVLFDGGDARTPLVLQVKQAGRSVLEPHAKPAEQDHQGRRVVEGQRVIQAAGDIFLGWTSGAVEGVDYYVRQLWDMKGKVDTELMSGESLVLFAELCGWTLARAHARSGDPGAIHGYLGSGQGFDRAIARFAVDYADQTERDHERLCEAISRGDVPGADGS